MTDNPTHEPLRVTAHMGAPVAYTPGEGLSLDGPLLYAAVLEREGQAYFESAPPPDDELAEITATPDPDMPLTACEGADTWIYRASMAERGGADGGTELLHWSKRYDELAHRQYNEAVDMGRRSVVKTHSGPYKSQYRPLYTEVVERLAWHVVGNRREVERLLNSHATHIGKKHGTGHGMVADWQVESVDVSADRWVKSGRRTLVRPVPLDMMEDDWGGEVGYAAVRPPYWLAAHQELCAVPASER